MNILAGHHAHDTNICYLVDGKVKYWNKLERLSRIKRDSGPAEECLKYQEVADAIDLNTLDMTVWGTPYPGVSSIYNPGPQGWGELFKNVPTTNFCNHHLSHASNAFYGSGFKTSYVLVIDRNGTLEEGSVPGSSIGCQTETLYYCEYPHTFEVVKSNKGWVGITGKYGIISEKCGIDDIDNGKTMGLAAYGNSDPIPYTMKNNNGEVRSAEELYAITTNASTRDATFIDMEEGHSAEDMAAFIQKETNTDILELIDSIEFDRSSNLCITGGHAHNCLTNFNIFKNLSNKNIKLYVDPIPDDSACSIGYAKYMWHLETGDEGLYPIQSLYSCGKEQ